MPTNCPLPLGEVFQCDECRYLADDKCWWFFPARDISDILTEGERLKRLELRDKPVPIAKTVSRDEINQLKGEVTYLLNKINNYVDKSKTKRHKYT